MGPPGSPALLTFMVKQVDEKHEEGHERLRGEIETMKAQIKSLEKAQGENVVQLTRFIATRERRHELSTNKTVIIAAAIGGGFRLAEVIITSVGHWLKP